ncbi:MAG: hypothetical protein JKY48_17820 [Flavobacteriales bacterium]|nr:hypothetical protein [Flavobacteriales bacterium]
MFEIFGIFPLIKILVLVGLLVYSGFVIGDFIASESTKNKAIHLFIGISVILSFLAIINTRGISVFTPSLLCILLLFKPQWKLNRVNLKASLFHTGQLFLFFLPFFLIEIYRQSYFSTEFISNSYGDYSYYLVTAQNIWDTGIETTYAYMHEYGTQLAPNLYHYFDLYLLVPAFLADIPPLIGYLFYFLPLIYALTVYSLCHIFSIPQQKILSFLLAFVSLHIVGVSFPEFEVFKKVTLIHFPKASFFVFAILLLKLKEQWSLTKTLIAVSFLSLMLNPLIFLLNCIVSVVIFLFYMKKEKLELKTIFKPIYLLIYLAFVLYFITIFTGKSENSVLNTFVEKHSLSQVISGIIEHFVGYLGIIKKLPVLLITLITLTIYTFRQRKIKFELLFVGLAFAIGHVVNSLMYNHYEGGQFFALPFVTFIVIATYFALITFFDGKNFVLKENKIFGIVLFGAIIFTFSIGGYTIFTKAKVLSPTSVVFNKEINKVMNSKKEINALFYKEFNDETPWISTMPYLLFDLGYLNLYESTSCIQPTHVNMFKTNKGVKGNAISLISGGPFALYCKELGLQPESIHDEEYKKAILGFIEMHEVNFLIFEREMKSPDWLKELTISEEIPPQGKLDKHRIYVL